MAGLPLPPGGYCWSDCEFVYTRGGGIVSAHTYQTSASADFLPGPLIVCRWDDEDPPGAGFPITVESDDVWCMTLCARPSGTLDLLYTMNTGVFDPLFYTGNELLHRTSRDNGVTWSSAAIVPTGLGRLWGSAENSKKLCAAFHPAHKLLCVVCRGDLLDGGGDNHWLLLADVDTDGDPDWSAPHELRDVSSLRIAWLSSLFPARNGDLLVSHSGARISQIQKAARPVLERPAFHDNRGTGWINRREEMMVRLSDNPNIYPAATPVQAGAYDPAPPPSIQWGYAPAAIPHGSFTAQTPPNGSGNQGRVVMCLRENQAGIWECLYPTAPDQDLDFIRCKNMARTQGHTWS